MKNLYVFEIFGCLIIIRAKDFKEALQVLRKDTYDPKLKEKIEKFNTPIYEKESLLNPEGESGIIYEITM